MRKSLEQAHRDLAKTLERSGYLALKAKHGKGSNGIKLGRLSATGFDGLSNRVSPNGPLRPSAAQHPDAKQFPIGHDHKQGASPDRRLR